MQAVIKIYTNTLIVQKSLTMSYTPLNFDSLDYFFKPEKPENLEYKEIVNQKKKALAGKEFTTKMESKIKDAEKATQDLQE